MRSGAQAKTEGELGAQLLEIVSALGVPYLHERSFRICGAGLFSNRFLLSLSKSSIRHRRHQTLLDLCERILLPRPFLESVERSLPAAASVHFGFEQNEISHLYKLYLELGSVVDEPGAPVLRHLAFKWDPGRPERRVVTRYLWHPYLPVDAIRERISAILGGPGHPEALDLALGVLEAAAKRMDPHEIQYLEVREDENARRSFDLNVYDADLRSRDFQPLLSRTCRRFGISRDHSEAFFAGIAGDRFGHLAGGVHREGRDFFNVYYGAERRNA